MSLLTKKLWMLLLAAAVTVAASPARAADDEEDDPFYKGFYGSNILFLTQANLSIGILGDAVAKKAYEGELGVQVAGAHAQMAAAAEGQYLEIAKSEDGEEDADLLKKMAKAASLIKDQSSAVVGIAKGDAAQGAVFGKAREATEKLMAEIRTEIGEILE
jgi:hypothetical protein